MMRVTIMQPYVFPYLGYYQLLHAADTFILLDDVNFIKKGWINRNRVQLNGEAHTFTIPIQGMSQNATIRASMIADDAAWKQKLLGTLQHAYRKAPHFDTHYPAIAGMIERAEGSIAELAAASIRYVATFAGLPTTILTASDIAVPAPVKGQERIVALAAHARATRYINPANGAAMYDEVRFAEAGMELRFLRMDNALSYTRNDGGPFIQGLSIIDVLMHCDQSLLISLLGRYQLLTSAEVAQTIEDRHPAA